MATYVKFNAFTVDQAGAKHDFTTHVFKVMLTNTVPVATNAVKTDITEIAAGNGYTAGGTASACTLSNASGVEKYVFANVVFTCVTAAMATFRYAVLYNDSQTAPVKPLISWVDYGSAVPLGVGETFTWTPDATNGLFTVT